MRLFVTDREAILEKRGREMTQGEESDCFSVLKSPL